MKPKLLRASVLGFLAGMGVMFLVGLIPLKNTSYWQGRYIGALEKIQDMEEELHVYELDLAERQAYDRQTWKQGKLDTLNIDDWVLIEHNGLQIWLPIIEPDTLDTLEGECDKCRQHGKLFNFREWLFCEDCLKKAKNNKEQNVPDRVQPNEEGE